MLTDDEIIAKAIEIIERDVIGEGCKTPDYEEFRDDPENIITPDINGQARCYCCAATQVVAWLGCYLAGDPEDNGDDIERQSRLVADATSEDQLTFLDHLAADLTENINQG